jgi:hypothetical protein
MDFRILAKGEPTDLAVSVTAFVSSGVTGFTDIYGQHHLIFFPSRFNKDPLIQGLHYVIEGTKVKLIERLPEAFGNARDIELIENKWGLVEGFVLADHGLEYTDKSWPFGDVYRFDVTASGNLVGKKISSFKAFNHNLALSDFNGDLQLDIIVQNMGQRGNPKHTDYEAMTAYVSTVDGYDLADLKFDRTGGVSWGGGAVAFVDLDEDGNEELIQASYDQPKDVTWRWGALRAFDINNKAELTYKYSIQPQGAALTMGVSDLVVSDWDSDGDSDILAIFEGRHPELDSAWSGTAFQFFQNTNGKLGLSSEIVLRSSDYPQREARLIDVNFDGSPDLVRQTLLNGQFKNFVYLNTERGFIPTSPLIELRAASDDHLFTRALDLNSFGPTFVSFYKNGTSLYPILWAFSTNLPVDINLNGQKSTVFGSNGNDIFRVNQNSAGSEIFGGLGTDSVYISDTKASFQISKNRDLEELILITASNDYSLTLTSIERVLFGGSGIAFDSDSAGGMAYRIYRSAFGRTPDKAGLGYWIAQQSNAVLLYFCR